MKIHRNARTCPHSRLLLCRRVVDRASERQQARAARIAIWRPLAAPL